MFFNGTQAAPSSKRHQSLLKVTGAQFRLWKTDGKYTLVGRTKVEYPTS